LESECVWFVDFVVGLGSLHYTIFHGPIADNPVLLFAVLHATADGIAHFGDRERRVEAMLDLWRGWLHSQPTGDAISIQDPYGAQIG
jgi:hypothetical protein